MTRYIDAMCAWIVVMNLLDAVLTMVWVGSGAAVEANPILAPLMAFPLAFVAVKMALVCLGVWVLRTCAVRGYVFATATLGVFVVAGFLLMVYHTQGVFLI